METWKQVWRVGVAPQLLTRGLVALRQAIITDDARLIQGGTTSPPPFACTLDWLVEAACLIGFCGWQSDGLKTVKEVEIYFGQVCFECDKEMREPAACRWLLNWFDETPREEMLKQLLPEVELELARREGV